LAGQGTSKPSLTVHGAGAVPAGPLGMKGEMPAVPFPGSPILHLNRKFSRFSRLFLNKEYNGNYLHTSWFYLFRVF